MKPFLLASFCLIAAGCSDQSGGVASPGESGRWRAVPADGEAGVMLTREKGVLHCSMMPEGEKIWMLAKIYKATEQDIHFTVLTGPAKKLPPFHLHLNEPLAGDTVSGSLRPENGTRFSQNVTLRRE